MHNSIQLLYKYFKLICLSVSGAVILLQKLYIDLFVFHCLCHRLELAYKDAIKQAMQKLYDRVQALLIGLYYFFKKK